MPVPHALEHPWLSLVLRWCIRASIFAAVLLGIRYFWTLKPWTLWMLWNLTLAWVPLGLALVAARLLPIRGLSRAGGGVVLVLWLLFFPNAPYILTDFIHYRIRWGSYAWQIPWWYELLWMVTVALTGLVLGLASLRIAHGSVTAVFGRAAGWLVVGLASSLVGVGIYLGRVQRWNSWDALLNPQAVLADALAPLLAPLHYPEAWALALGFGLGVGGLYLAWHLHLEQARIPAPDPGPDHAGASPAQ